MGYARSRFLKGRQFVRTNMGRGGSRDEYRARWLADCVGVRLVLGALAARLLGLHVLAVVALVAHLALLLAVDRARMFLVVRARLLLVLLVVPLWVIGTPVWPEADDPRAAARPRPGADDERAAARNGRSTRGRCSFDAAVALSDGIHALARMVEHVDGQALSYVDGVRLFLRRIVIRFLVDAAVAPDIHKSSVIIQCIDVDVFGFFGRLRRALSGSFEVGADVGVLVLPLWCVAALDLVLRRVIERVTERNLRSTPDRSSAVSRSRGEGETRRGRGVMPRRWRRAPGAKGDVPPSIPAREH